MGTTMMVTYFGRVIDNTVGGQFIMAAPIPVMWHRSPSILRQWQHPLVLDPIRRPARDIQLL